MQVVSVKIQELFQQTLKNEKKKKTNCEGWKFFKPTFHPFSRRKEKEKGENGKLALESLSQVRNKIKGKKKENKMRNSIEL